MSSTAPWLALAVDFDESEMWDSLPQYGIEEESTMGERLAWVCLLCEAKKKGRGGKVSVRAKVFQKAHRLTGRAVDGMLNRAQKCGAIEINGDFITLCGWRVYQDKTGGKKSVEMAEVPDIPEKPSTKDQPPRTKDQPPRTSSASAFVRPSLAEVEAYCIERGKGVDARKWFDHYESNGWRVGRNAMKDWKAAVRKWENSEYGNQRTNSRNSSYTGRFRG